MAARTKAILKVLARGGEDKVANTVMKIFGASSLEECAATYDLVGAAERATLGRGGGARGGERQRGVPAAPRQ